MQSFRIPARGIIPFACLIGFLFASLNAGAQETTATLFGSVRDAQNAAVPKTRITATNEQTRFTRQTVTDENGNYTLPLLPVGNYELIAEASGFQKYLRRGITLTVNQAGRIDIELAVGSVSEVVQVTSETGLVNTQN